jgi:hypothetical protein
MMDQRSRVDSAVTDFTSKRVGDRANLHETCIRPDISLKYMANLGSFRCLEVDLQKPARV